MKINHRHFLGLALVGLVAVVASWLWYDYEPDRIVLADVPRESMAPKIKVSELSIPTNRPIRLAVCGLGMSDRHEEGQVADLILASLSAQESFDMIERRQLEAVLKETQLSLYSLSGPSQAVKVGQLLHADWLIMGSQAKVGTNQWLLIRLVDAPTGVIRDMTFVRYNGRVAMDLAQELCTFVMGARSGNGKGTGHAFLAIGQFRDIGVNDRQGAFVRQLSTRLAAGLGERGITLLEREQVNALLQELRLNAAGLSVSVEALPAMQTAVWFVDGYYQSFEEVGRELEMLVRVERMHAGQWRRVIKGVPDEAFFRNLQTAVHELMSSNNVAGTYMAHSKEINAHLEIAEERSRLTGSELSTPEFAASKMRGDMYYATRNRHKESLEEAIKAYETVLMLDPNHNVAKLSLAICMMAPSIQRLDEARGILREIISTCDKEIYCAYARHHLAYSYIGTGEPEKAIEVMQPALEATTDPKQREWIERQIQRYQRLIDKKKQDSMRIDGPEFEQQMVEQLKEFRSKGQTNIVMREVEVFNDMRYALAQEPDVNTQWLTPCMARMTNQFPELRPYILAGFLSLRVGPQSAIAAEFRKAVVEAAAAPSKVFCPASFFKQLMDYPWTWALRHKERELLVTMADGCRKAIQEGYALAMPQNDQIRVAYAYYEAGRWKEALELLEPYGTTVIEMDSPGPWGDTHAPFVPELMAKVCRAKLGMAPRVYPGIFEAPVPLVSESQPVEYLVDGDDMWIASASMLRRRSIQGNGADKLFRSVMTGSKLTSVAQSNSKIWVGTDEEGLFEWDKATGSHRWYTRNDGLLRDEVLALAFKDDKLYIGVGTDREGGVSCLNVGSGTITSFMMPLSVDNPVLDVQRRGAVHDPLDGPPNAAVRALAFGLNNTIWMGVLNKGIQRHDFGGKGWFTFETSDPMSDTASLAVNDRWMVAGSDNVWTGRNDRRGGMTIMKLSEGKPQFIGKKQGLSHECVSGVALDGDRLWIGGYCQLSVMDLNTQKIFKTALFNDARVEDLVIDQGFLYFKHGNKISRVPLSVADTN